jgi:hypothetical protein
LCGFAVDAAIMKITNAPNDLRWKMHTSQLEGGNHHTR